MCATTQRTRQPTQLFSLPIKRALIFWSEAVGASFLLPIEAGIATEELAQLPIFEHTHSLSPHSLQHHPLIIQSLEFFGPRGDFDKN